MHRKVMDNPIFSNANMLKLWILCLLKATHTEHKQLVGNQIIVLQQGQFITGRDALFNEFNKGAKSSEVVSSVSLWRWLKKFEEWQMLNIKTTTKYSVVTVFNWVEYQQSEQQVNNKRTANEQQMITNNNVNNANKENKKDMSIQQAEHFESWWNLYGKKEGRTKCEKKFNQLVKKHGYEIIEQGTKSYLNHRERLKATGDFVPQQKNPLTFLNGEHFNDEYETGSQVAATTQSTNYQKFDFDISRGED
ncbi:hypothetical protein ACPA0F_20395 [Solibacillus silvestris]